MEIKPIGGYFEIETFGNGGNFPHPDGLKLNTGRNALEYILASIGNVSRVYIPYYTCEVILEPFKKLNIKYDFYRIDQNLEIAEELNPLSTEYILYTNYYGIMDEYIQKLSIRYGDQLIVDCAQALYAKHIKGIKTFYSPRKFVGIPDGAIVYIDDGINPIAYGVDESTDRMSHLYIRKEKGPQVGYADFRNNANKLKMNPILNMSLETRDMIDRIDFVAIKEKRQKNFKQLHESLVSTNKLGDLLTRCLSVSTNGGLTPMVYPYWTDNNYLKTKLIKEQVFVATYWPNVLEWVESGSFEYELANNCLAIPCDQRCGESDINRIIKIILSAWK